MRDRHEERALELLALGELGDHPSKTVAEQRDLVAAARIRDLDVVATGRDVLGRSSEGEDGLRESPGEPPEEHSGQADPDCEREREAPQEGQPLRAKLGHRLCDDEPTERLRPASEPNRLRGGDQPRVVARWRELEGHQPVAWEIHFAERGSWQPGQPEALPRKERQSDVEKLVAGRQLEVSRRKCGRLRPLVARRGAQPARTDRRDLQPHARARERTAVRVTSWKSRTASAIETRPNTSTTVRKRAVSRKRSVPSMGAF